MINFNANINSVVPNNKNLLQQNGKITGEKANFSEVIRAAGKYISEVDEVQQSSDTSIKELLAGKNQDIAAVVAAVAKADMSFKVLVGVRNKLIEAYKQTMNMPI